MLCFAHVHQELWFFSLFALVPLLWRLGHVSRGQALILGLITATTYVFAAHFGRLLTAPGDFVIKLATLNASFAGSAFAISSLRSRFRLNPLTVASISLPAGCLIIHRAGFGGMIGADVGLGLLVGLGSLGGLVACSAVLVLSNLVILPLARYVKRRLLRRIVDPADGFRQLVAKTALYHFTPVWYAVPKLRGPPAI